MYAGLFEGKLFACVATKSELALVAFHLLFHASVVTKLKSEVREHVNESGTCVAKTSVQFVFDSVRGNPWVGRMLLNQQYQWNLRNRVGTSSPELVR